LTAQTPATPHSTRPFASIEDAPVTLDKNGNITMRIFLDRSSVEVFAQKGLKTITEQVFHNPGADKIALFAEGGTAQLKSPPARTGAIHFR
jgi:levanase